jgi:hypothetical protein
MQCGVFDDDYRAQFRSCEVDSDCQIVNVRLDCLGGRGVYGIASGDREEFERCLPDQVKLRKCPDSDKPPRAEDGRIAALDLRDVRPHCVAGQCRALVDERACGSTEHVCGPDQICVSHTNAMGVPAFDCVTNPCAGQQLDCAKCAHFACEALAGQLQCAVENLTDGTADVYCKVERR